MSQLLWEFVAALYGEKDCAVLDRLCVERGGPPAFVRFNNGPEFVAYAIAYWCRFNHVDAVFIDPRSPWQNAWIESFNSRLRDENNVEVTAGR